MALSNNFNLFSKDSQDGNRKKEKKLSRDEASVSQVEEESEYKSPGFLTVEKFRQNVKSKTEYTYFANNGKYSPGFGPKREAGSSLNSNVPSSSGNLSKFFSSPESSSTYNIQSSFSSPQLQSRIGFPDSSLTSNKQSIVNVYDSRSTGNAQRPSNSCYSTSLSNVHSTLGQPDSNSLQYNNAQTAYSPSNVNSTSNLQSAYKPYDSSSTCNESKLSPYDSSSTGYVQRTRRASHLLPNSNTSAFVERTGEGLYDQIFTAINQNKGMTCVGFSDSTYKGNEEIRNFTGHSWSENTLQIPVSHEFSSYNKQMLTDIVQKFSTVSCTDYSHQSSDTFNVQKAVSENLKERARNQERLKKNVPNFFDSPIFSAFNDGRNLLEKAQEEKGKEVTFEFMKLDESKTTKTKKTKLKEREDKLKYSVCEAANLVNTGDENDPKSNEQPSQAESPLQSDEKSENKPEAGKEKGENKREQ